MHFCCSFAGWQNSPWFYTMLEPVKKRSQRTKHIGYAPYSNRTISHWVVAIEAWSHRKAVLLWPQLWAPTPPIWECWTWATITQGTLELRCSLLDWRIHAGDWTLSGMERTAHHWGTKSPTWFKLLLDEVVWRGSCHSCCVERDETADDEGECFNMLLSLCFPPSVEHGGVWRLKPALKKCKLECGGWNQI
jgi:hypothetical protein